MWDPAREKGGASRRGREGAGGETDWLSGVKRFGSLFSNLPKSLSAVKMPRNRKVRET